MTETRFKRVARNAGWLGAGEFGSRALGLLTVLYLARTLGPEGYGAIGVAAALFGFLGVLAYVGTAPQAIRSVARDPASAPEVFSTITGLRIVATGSIALIVAISALPLSGLLGVPAGLLLLYIATLPPSVLLPWWAFRGLDRMHVPASMMFVERAIILVLLVMFVGSGPNAIYRVPLIEALVGVAVGVVLVRLLVLEYGALKIRLDRKSWPPILNEGGKITFSRVLERVYLDGDAILLAAMTGTSAAAVFVVGHKIALTAVSAAGIFHQSAFPMTLRIAVDDPRAAVAYQSTLLRYLQLFLALPVCVGIAGADQIVALLYGNAYVEAAAVLRISLLAVPFAVLSNALRRLLIALADSRGMVGGAVVAVSLHVPLAIFLIPVHGASGAAIACVAGEVGSALWLLREVRRAAGAMPVAAVHVVPWLGGGFGIGAFGYVASMLDQPWGFVAAAAIGVAVFVSVSVALRAVRQEDLRRLRSLAPS